MFGLSTVYRSLQFMIRPTTTTYKEIRAPPPFGGPTVCFKMLGTERISVPSRFFFKLPNFTSRKDTDGIVTPTRIRYMEYRVSQTNTEDRESQYENCFQDKKQYAKEKNDNTTTDRLREELLYPKASTTTAL